MQLDQNQVYTFKLNSGEELIARVEKPGAEWITISDPVSVAPGPQGMGLVPSMFTADPDKNPRLNMNCVAISALTDENVRMKYIEATTGIKVPEKRILVG